MKALSQRYNKAQHLEIIKLLTNRIIQQSFLFIGFN